MTTAKFLTAFAAATCMTAGLSAAQSTSVKPPHLCAGIGEDSRAEADAFPHTAKFVFAEEGGAFLGDVSATITQDGETVLAAVCDGPWLLAELPSGTYDVDIFYAGQMQSIEVNVDGDAVTERVVTF